MADRPGRERKKMKHVYQNDDGEQIAADTKEQAARYHDCELGGAKELPEDWEEDWSVVPDSSVLTINVLDGVPETKTAREWAAEHDSPNYVSSTYA